MRPHVKKSYYFDHWFLVLMKLPCSWCFQQLWFLAVSGYLFLPFWYGPTRVVPDKGPLNGCVCVCVWVLDGVCQAWYKVCWGSSCSGRQWHLQHWCRIWRWHWWWVVVQAVTNKHLSAFALECYRQFAWFVSLLQWVTFLGNLLIIHVIFYVVLLMSPRKTNRMEKYSIITSWYSCAIA